MLCQNVGPPKRLLKEIVARNLKYVGLISMDVEMIVSQ